MNKNITLEITDEATHDISELNFTVGTLEYNEYMNAIKSDDKIAPSVQFLRDCVDDESREAVEDLIKQNGALLLVGELLEDYMPAIKVAVKKSKRKPKK